MKRYVILAIMGLIFLSGCAENKEISDFTGIWVEANTTKTYQQAVIENETIIVHFVNPTENSKMLYWAGTYVAPSKSVKDYSWESVNDKEKTDGSLFGSSSDIKVFTYKDGKLTYDVSMMGTTATVELQMKEN